jgi:hypothetical protein
MERGAATVPDRSARSFPSIPPMLVGPDALRWHAAAFAGGAVILTLVNVLRSPDRLWFWAPLLVWCGVLAAHAALTARGRVARAAASTPALALTVAPALGAATTGAPAPSPTTTAAPDPDPAPAAAPPPGRMPAAAELAALRLSLDPWATAALAATGAGQDELSESVLALWRLADRLGARSARPEMDLTPRPPFVRSRC